MLSSTVKVVSRAVNTLWKLENGVEQIQIFPIKSVIVFTDCRAGFTDIDTTQFYIVSKVYSVKSREKKFLFFAKWQVHVVCFSSITVLFRNI